MPAPHFRILFGSRSPLVVSLILTLLLAACGGGSGEPSPQAASSPTPEASDAAFPVTINHKYGSTEIREAPQRVVSVGYNDHDAILALGVKPIAVRDWFGDQPFATWPWAQEELGDAKPTVLSSGELDFEQIAGLQPDLILGLYSGLTEEEYTTLSEIAPTVAQPGEYIDWGIPWQEQTLVIGRALGKEAQAKELVAGVEAQFAAARAQHPEFNGATAVVAWRWEGGYGVYGPQDPKARVLTSLDFQILDQIAQLTGDQNGAEISREQLQLLDADVLLWYPKNEAEREALEGDALYQNLTVPGEGRDVFLIQNEPVDPVKWGLPYGAMAWSTVLSLPYLLDELVPQLAAAVDGDPATATTPGS